MTCPIVDEIAEARDHVGVVIGIHLDDSLLGGFAAVVSRIHHETLACIAMVRHSINYIRHCARSVFVCRI